MLECHWMKQHLSTGSTIMTSLLRAALEPKAPNAPHLTFRETAAAWWRACRPPFLITAAIPVTLALAFTIRAGADPAWGRFVLTLAGCFLGLTIANFANDLFDHIQGVDAGDNIGGSRVIQSGLISPRQLSVALIVLLLATFAVAARLIATSGLPWLWGLVFFAAGSAIFYVAPPIRYGHRGAGEVFVCLNMGFIMVAGTVTVLTGRFFPASLALSLPVGLMVAGVMYYQSLPEIETDPAAGKHTLASKLGKSGAVLLFRLWWPAVWVLLLNLWACGLADWPVALGLLAVPLYCRAVRLLRRALVNDDWLSLDAHGHLVRKLYLCNGLALILGVGFAPLRAVWGW